MEEEDNQEQSFNFELTEELANNEEVEIDVSDANAEAVDYENAEIEASGNNNEEIRDGGDTLVFRARGGTEGDHSITVTNVDVEPDTVQEFDPIVFTRLDNDDTSRDSFEITEE